jgi:hypothetical protein
MKTQTPALALLALSTALYGCQQRSTENAPVTTTSPAGESTAPASAAAERRDDALVRFVNAIPSQAVVDLYADNDRTFDNVAFRAVTPYREVNGERYTFALRPAGLDREHSARHQQRGAGRRRLLHGVRRARRVAGPRALRGGPGQLLGPRRRQGARARAYMPRATSASWPCSSAVATPAFSMASTSSR